MYFGEEYMCSCGNLGCVQSILSGPSLVELFNKLETEKVNSVDDIFNLRKNQNNVAVNFIDEFVRNISRIIYNIALMLNINCFIIGGGALSHQKEIFCEIEYYVNRKLKVHKRSVSVMGARYLDDSGIYGVQQLVKNYLSKKEMIAN